MTSDTPHSPQTLTMADFKKTADAFAANADNPLFSPHMTSYVHRYVESQKLLGARWPNEEFLLVRTGRHGEYAFRRFRPSDSLYPWFEHPFTARRLKAARDKTTGWGVGGVRY